MKSFAYSLMAMVIIVVAAAAQDRLPDSLLKEYYHAIAAQVSQEAIALQAEALAKRSHDQAAEIKKEVEAIRAKLKGKCPADKPALSESGVELECVSEKPSPVEPPAK